MAAGIKNCQLFEGEQDLLDFARSYLSEAFPNPERKGCPTDDALRTLARRPTQGNASISDHLTSCSPCFNAYMAHLAHAKAEAAESKRSRRALLVRRSLVTVVVFMIAVYVFFNRRHSELTLAPSTPGPVGKPATASQRPATATYVPVLVDLSNASPTRGLDRAEARPLPQVIPSSPLIDLNLQLPLGSEERGYSIRLSSKRNVVWSGSAKAHSENGQMLLRMHADLSHVPAGKYDLVVGSKGFRVTAPVLMKGSSSGRIQ